jgi:hypothetical protein
MINGSGVMGDEIDDDGRRVIFSMAALDVSMDGAGCWSNDDGWVRPELATVFTAEEASSFALPIDESQWMTLREARLRCDAEVYPEQLDGIYNEEGDGGHPDFTREDWRGEVASENTLLGYWQECAAWLRGQVEDLDEQQAMAADGFPAPGAG